MDLDAPRHDPGAPGILLSPHLDDAVWSAYSVLTGPDPVVLVNVFAGIPAGGPGWWDRRRGIEDSGEQVRARIAEDAAAAAHLGREVVNLPLLDDQYRDGPPAVEEALRALAERLPAVGRVWSAAGIGGHPDHEYVRDVGLALAARGFPTTLVTDFSYSVRRGWPTWVDPERGREAADEQWRASLGGVAGVDLARPRIRRLTPAEADAKLETMRMYVTQYDAIEAEEPRWNDDGLPPSDPALRSVEVWYDVTR